MTRAIFHAPLKPPDHPDPSGDREMARLLLKALDRAGIAVETPCPLRMFDRGGDPALMRRLSDEARRAAQAYVDEVRRRVPEDRPDTVLTYHVHYKAPDVFGPAVADALALPYVVVEGSRAPKRAGGAWRLGHELAEAALDRADAVLIVNARDRAMLERFRPPGQALVDFPPFLDADAWPTAERPRTSPGSPPRLLAVAMMRPGDKLASYRLLAASLELLAGHRWVLHVAGDGPARAEVEAAFRPFADRVTMLGELDRLALARAYASADLLVWPAVNEAFGMVFLEAALFGCPALAGAYGGVPGVIRDGVTGLLAEPGNVNDFTDKLTTLLQNSARLSRLGESARADVLAARGLDAAARRLRDALEAGRAAHLERSA
ncbi:glycosyltransferase family 4 protein [Alsobacter soli]|nr:glycosyltransferase family 4 protein [Alsobacter soli]